MLERLAVTRAAATLVEQGGTSRFSPTRREVRIQRVTDLFLYRWGLSEQRMTLRELARRWNVSGQRVGQVEQRARRALLHPRNAAIREELFGERWRSIL